MAQTRGWQEPPWQESLPCYAGSKVWFDRNAYATRPVKFVDYVTITVRSGRGGPGAVAFRREKHEPRGGPAGGDGGDGGSVILLGDNHLYTLLDFRYNRHHFAGGGGSGAGNNRKGANGEDIVLRVPLGTIVKQTDTGEVIGEVNALGDRLVLARGGRGGKGNAFFKSPTNRAPRHAQPGEEGEGCAITLELALLADVGLVGFPNAGKSMLISTVSAARPKVADYPFTTVEPALGVVYVGAFQSFVMADVPGIIEGAHAGRGLGLRFLRHIERNAVLLFLIPVNSIDPSDEYATLLEELRAYDESLLEKPRIVALSKTDLLPPEERASLPNRIRAEFSSNVEVLPISAVAGFGLDRLKERLWTIIRTTRDPEEVSDEGLRTAT